MIFNISEGFGRKVKKIISTILVLIIASMALFSCGENTDNSGEQSLESNTEESKVETLDEKYAKILAFDTYHEMRVVKKGGYYNISYVYDNGAEYQTQLTRKRWGTYILGAYRYKDENGKTLTFVTDSTDCENVYNCGLSAGNTTFRGGNHGDYGVGGTDMNDDTKVNDRFTDLTFYDAKTKNPLTLEEGKVCTAQGLYVVEHPRIYEGEYKEENIIMEMERQYIFNGEDIFLECNIDVVHDTYFYTSYSTMLPISKAYGNMAKFYNQDGTEKTVQTPLVGKSNFGSNFSDNNDALKVEIWGEKNPQYHFIIEIYSAEQMQIKSQFKTRLWDMSPSQNKLYFSMFRTNAPTVIKAGTHWDTLARWSFSLQPDFVNPDEVDQKLGF